MDVTAAFLNGDLEEEIYMKLPEGFAELHEEPSYFRGRVAKLNKALYGLKQAMRCWNTRLTNYLKKSGYCQSQADPSLFVLQEREKVKSIIAVYVDDCLIIGMRPEVLEAKQVLAKEFKMTDQGRLTGMLGINFNITNEEVRMDQTFYTESLLEKFGMENSRPISTPILPEEKEEEGDRNLCDQKLFRQAVGGLLYLSRCTRPDIAFAVNQVAQSMERPTESDWRKVKRIFRYLNGTRSHGLIYAKGGGGLIGYSDASYAQTKSRKSTSGYTFKWNGGAITWRSKRQPIVATSSMEAEYIALASAVKEALWIRKLVQEFRVSQAPIAILEDNQACIRFSHDQNHNDRTKHIDVRYLFIKDRIELDQVKITYCPTNEMIADLMTKPLGPIQFNHLVRLLGVRKTNASA